MTKRGFFPVKAALFLVLVLFGTILLAVFVAAPLVCDYKNTACTASETKVLGLSNYTDAHAELPNQTSYGWNVCCKVQGTPTALNTSCLSADTNLTGLNSSDGKGITNSHLEIAGYGGIRSPGLACLSATPGTVLCAKVNQSCPFDEECLFTQSNITNAHGGDCGERTGNDTYGWRTCCKYHPTECGQYAQTCCEGECNAGLACVGNKCVSTGVGSDANSTLWGYVRNATGIPISGAKVAALGTNITYTTGSGYYELKFGNSAGSPYDLVASASGFESQTAPAFYFPSGVSLQKDFTLMVYRGDCNDDCTTVGSNLCSKDCQGKGFCWFYNADTMNACDGVFGWKEMPNGQYVNCCKGVPANPVKAQVSVPCASDIVNSQSVVLYLGKLLKMNILMFKRGPCQSS